MNDRDDLVEGDLIMTGDKRINLRENFGGEILSREDFIYRYMSFEKFEDFMRRGIYFSRVDCFDDTFEGDYTEAMHHMSKYVYCVDGSGEKIKGALQNNKQAVNKSAYASCWALRESESWAHWKIYGGGGDSVAIKTSVGKLIQQLESSACRPGVNCRCSIEAEADCKRKQAIVKFFSRKSAVKISYISYSDLMEKNMDLAKWHGEDDINRLLCKYVGYDYEDEMRVLYDFIGCPSKNFGEGEGSFLAKDLGQGLVVPIDPRQLLVEVIVAPDTDELFFELVRRILEESKLENLLRRSVFCASPSQKARLSDI